MPQNQSQEGHLVRLAKLSLLLLLVTLGLGLVVTVVEGVLVNARYFGWAAVHYTLVALGEVAGGVVLVLAYRLLKVRLEGRALLVRLHDRARRLEALLEACERSLRRLSELAPLSDQAKAMIYRERELEALQEVIHESLARQDYRHAEQLIDRMADQFGYQEEAEQFRAEVRASQEAGTDEKLTGAIGRVDRIIDRHNWARALRESERLRRVYPASELVKNLPRKVDEARARHKRELLTQYGEAVRRNDLDRSIELLRDLDAYLTPQEASAMEESARGVFRAKLHNLGVQFAIAVTDEQWDSAVKIGEEITREFPNSRMAEEVRQKFDALRQRAAAVAK